MKETVSPAQVMGTGIPGGGEASEGLGERILRRLIRSPKLKSSLNVMMKGIDPDHAPGLVRALMWGDVETFMGMSSALPRLANFIIRAAEEVVAQLNAFPPEILAAFLGRLAGEVDFQALERATREARLLLEKVGPVVEGLRERAVKAVTLEPPGKESPVEGAAGEGKE